MSARSKRSASAPRRSRRFHVLSLALPGALADEVVGLLAGEALGAACDPRDDGTTRVRVYFDRAEPARRAKARARLVLAGRGGESDPALSRVADEPRVERFQAALRPFDLGCGFRVFPRGRPGGGRSDGGRIPIRLAPGRAFGTGRHETTALCAEYVERLVRPGSTWLDLGCGTGILAIVAAHRGAREVWALDSDAEAVAVAREVVARNGLSRRVRVAVGSLAEAARRRWDGVVANLELPFFVREAGTLAGLLGEGGRLIASGFLRRDAALVARLFRRAGLPRTTSRRRGEWAAVVAEREGRS